MVDASLFTQCRGFRWRLRWACAADAQDARRSAHIMCHSPTPLPLFEYSVFFWPRLCRCFVFSILAPWDGSSPICAKLRLDAQMAFSAVPVRFFASMAVIGYSILPVVFLTSIVAAVRSPLRLVPMPHKCEVPCLLHPSHYVPTLRKCRLPWRVKRPRTCDRGEATSDSRSDMPRAIVGCES